jgi:hypothetical protein
VPTGFSRATEPTRTSPSRFGCGPSILGDGSDRLWLRLSLLEVEKPDRTGPLNTTTVHHLLYLIPLLSSYNLWWWRWLCMSTFDWVGWNWHEFDDMEDRVYLQH